MADSHFSWTDRKEGSSYIHELVVLQSQNNQLKQKSHVGIKAIVRSAWLSLASTADNLSAFKTARRANIE